MSRNVPRIFDPSFFSLFDETNAGDENDEKTSRSLEERPFESLVFFTESRIRTGKRTIAAISNKLFIRNRPR